MGSRGYITRLCGVLEGRLFSLLRGDKTFYERTLVDGNLNGFYKQDKDGIDIEIYSVKSKLLVYKLFVRKRVDGLFVESIPYYRGKVHKGYFAGMFVDSIFNTNVKEGFEHSIRTDEQREFLLSLLLGEGRGQDLINALGKVVGYLFSGKYNNKLTNFGVFSNYLGVGYKYACQVDCSYDGTEVCIELGVYKGEFNELCADLRVKYIELGACKGVVIASSNRRSREEVEFEIKGFDESLIQVCVDNILSIDGVEKEFVKLLKRIGFNL